MLRRWHLLSLDAPTIAVLWTWFIASHHHVEMPSTVLVAMFLAVWILYASDRLLDFSRQTSLCELKERHLFHGSHQYAFTLGILFSALLLVAFLMTFPAPLLLSYSCLSGVVVLYFIFVHLTPGTIPKELAVGIIFAIATFIPTLTRGGCSWELSMQCLSFATVCWLNCSLINSWEGTLRISRFPLVRLETLTALLLFFGLFYRSDPLAIPTACGMSLAILLGLDLFSRHIAVLNLRICADAALLTPIVVVMVSLR